MLKFINELWDDVKAIFGWLAAMFIVFIGIVLIGVAVSLVQITIAAVLVFIMILFGKMLEILWIF